MSENIDHEGRIAYLAEQIERAKSNAMPENEYNQIQERFDQATNEFLNGRIDSNKYNQITGNLGDERGLLKFNNEDDFYVSLQLLGFSPEMVEELFCHELDHATEAQNHGMRPIYIIRLVKDSDGSMYLQPSILFDWSDEALDDDMARNMLRSVIEAPKELSPSDEKKLSN